MLIYLLSLRSLLRSHCQATSSLVPSSMPYEAHLKCPDNCVIGNIIGTSKKIMWAQGAGIYYVRRCGVLEHTAQETREKARENGHIGDTCCAPCMFPPPLQGCASCFTSSPSTWRPPRINKSGAPINAKSKNLKGKLHLSCFPCYSPHETVEDPSGLSSKSSSLNLRDSSNNALPIPEKKNVVLEFGKYTNYLFLILNSLLFFWLYWNC